MKDVKFIPFDPINISTHICICLNGHFLGENNLNLWEDFTINEKSMDYYFYQWHSGDDSSSSMNILRKSFKDEVALFVKSFNSKDYDFNLFQLREKKAKDYLLINKAKAKLAGKFLALTIASRSVFKFHTISLIGFSLGCEVIKSCLQEIYKIVNDYDYSANEIIQNIVFIGGCCKIKNKHEGIFNNISGRLINLYSTYDYLLANYYSKVAIGLHSIFDKKQNNINVENYDLSYLKLGQNDYKREFDKILNKISII